MGLVITAKANHYFTLKSHRFRIEHVSSGHNKTAVVCGCAKKKEESLEIKTEPETNLIATKQKKIHRERKKKAKKKKKNA